MKTPTELGEPQIREYLHHLIDDLKVSCSTHKMAVAAIKFLYKTTLNRPDVVASVPWPKTDHRLPNILSFQELFSLFQAAPNIFLRTTFMVGYTSGLRVNEICHLRIDDIDSNRGVLHVREGKGNKERLTLLPERLLTALRDYWRIVRPPGPWLFPGGTPEGTVGRTKLQRGFREAAKRARIRKRVTPHSLRHSFATLLFEAGTDSRVIQELLGHRSPRSTARYLKVRADFIRRVPCPLQLMEEHLKRSL
jgi:site-specific recombinase XerD